MASARPPARPPTHHLLKFPLLSRADLDNTPSRKDGVSMEMEDRRRLLTAQHVKLVSYNLQMGIDTWAIAMTLFYRFYARKSMKKNNTFIVAAACLFLAGKVNDKPRHHSKVANMLLARWYGKDNPQLQRLAAGAPTQDAAAVRHLPPAQVAEARAFWENMYASVLEAERSLLYTLGFDFNIDILHTHLARLLKRPRFWDMGLGGASKAAQDFQQYAISLANDIYTKDGTLVLEWPLDKIAITVFYVIFKGLKSGNIKHIPMPAPTASGVPWYVEEGLGTEECQVLSTRITAVYGAAKRSDKGGAARPGGAAAATASARGGRPAASAATAGGAGSTMMLGACESVAYSGAGTVMGGGISDLGEHTSVARPLSSEAGSGAGSKRPAADSPAGGGPGPAALSPAAAAGTGTAGHVNKRARQEEPAAAACHEATSASRRTPASLTPTSLTPASQGCMQPPGGAARSPAPAAAQQAQPAAPAAKPAPPAQAAAAPAAAAAAAEDSEKEEGELEEGELA